MKIKTLTERSKQALDIHREYQDLSLKSNHELVNYLITNQKELLNKDVENKMLKVYLGIVGILYVSLLSLMFL